jgi:hypothetical protein
MKPPSQIIHDTFRHSINKWHEDSSHFIKPAVYLKMSLHVQFAISDMIGGPVYDAVYEQVMINP